MALLGAPTDFGIHRCTCKNKGMSKSQASKKSLPVALGGLALAVVAGYFGFDLGGDGDSSAASSPSESAGGAKAGDADTCEMSSLPAEANDTKDDILAGGPYDLSLIHI